MGWLNQNWRWVAVGVCVGTLAALLVDLLVLGFGKPLWSQEAAGWVQAIGSIAAIGGSTWIANRQTQRAVETERRARKRELADRFEREEAQRSAARQLLRVGAKAVRTACELAEKPNGLFSPALIGASVPALESAADMLLAFPVQDLRWGKLIQAYFAVLADVRQTLQQISMLRQAIEENVLLLPEVYAGIAEQFRALKQAAHEDLVAYETEFLEWSVRMVPTIDYGDL